MHKDQKRIMKNIVKEFYYVKKEDLKPTKTFNQILKVMLIFLILLKKNNKKLNYKYVIIILILYILKFQEFHK